MTYLFRDRRARAAPPEHPPLGVIPRAARGRWERGGGVPGRLYRRRRAGRRARDRLSGIRRQRGRRHPHICVASEDAARGQERRHDRRPREPTASRCRRSAKQRRAAGERFVRPCWRAKISRSRHRARRRQRRRRPAHEAVPRRRSLRGERQPDVHHLEAPAPTVTTAVRAPAAPARRHLALVIGAAPSFSVSKEAQEDRVVGEATPPSSRSRTVACRSRTSSAWENAGFLAIMTNFVGRLLLAVQCVAIARRLAYRRSIRYARERMAFRQTHQRLPGRASQARRHGRADRAARRARSPTSSPSATRESRRLRSPRWPERVHRHVLVRLRPGRRGSWRLRLHARDAGRALYLTRAGTIRSAAARGRS